MSERINAPHVGSPDPEKRNAPIIDETAANDLSGEDLDSIEFAYCHFNDVPYDDGSVVCSGDELLRCDKGKWLRVGTCDPDHP